MPEFYITQKMGQIDKTKISDMESPLEPAVIAANTREPTIWEKKNKNLNDHAEEIEGSNRRTKQLQSRIMHF